MVSNSNMHYRSLHHHIKLRKEKLTLQNEDYDWVFSDPVLKYLSPVLSTLHEDGLITLDENSIHVSQTAYYQNKARWFLYNQEFQKILRIFQKYNIDVIPLKAFAYAEQLYPNRALRTFSDIDILVKPNQIINALYHLYQAGFILIDEKISNIIANINKVTEVTLLSPSGCVVEIHHSLLPVKNFFRYDHVHTINLEQIWNRASKTDIDEFKIYNLSLIDTLAHLCLHAGSHGLSAQSPFTYLDLDCWIRANSSTIDWEAFVKRVEEWKIRSTAYHTFELTKTIYQTPIPSDIIKKLDPGYFAKWRLSQVYSIDNYLSHNTRKIGILQPKFVRLLLIDRFIDILKILLYGLIPPRQFREVVYDQRTNLIAHWKKIFLKISS